jgi:hypothetical protein
MLSIPEARHSFRLRRLRRYQTLCSRLRFVVVEVQEFIRWANVAMCAQ